MNAGLPVVNNSFANEWVTPQTSWKITKEKSVLDLYLHPDSKLKEELTFLINDTNRFYNIPPPPQ